MKSNDKAIIKTERMSYEKYKNEFKWNPTIIDSYDKKDKTILVVTQCKTDYMHDK
jgi:hypothetical protein